MAKPKVTVTKKTEGDGTDQTQGEVKKGLPLWIIILGASQLVVVLIGVGGFLLFMPSKESKAPPPTKKEAAEEAPAVPAQDVNPAEALTYGPLTVLISSIGKNGSLTYVKLQIAFRLEDEEGRTLMDANIDAVREELSMRLSEKSPNEFTTGGSRESLQVEILGWVNGVLKQPKVKSIHFMEFTLN